MNLLKYCLPLRLIHALAILGAAARFSYPTSIAVDTTGTIYVADPNNHRIARGVPVPTFQGFRLLNGSQWATTLGGIRSASAVVFEASSDLRVWQSVGTNRPVGETARITLPLNRLTPSLFLRAAVR